MRLEKKTGTIKLTGVQALQQMHSEQSSSNNIMLKDFAEELFSEYQKILNEKKSPEAQNATDKESQNEADSIPF